MNFKSIWQEIVSVWQSLLPNWKALVQKGLPYALAVVFVSATIFTALGVQGNKAEYENIYATKTVIESEKQTLQTSQEELEAKLAESQALLSQITEANANTQALLEEAEERQNAVTDKINELKETYESMEKWEQQRWVLPIQYTNCTSKFGYRDHPVIGEGRYHYGVDLAAPLGTPIVASRSGTVTIATYEETAGNYVNIDHLDGFTTRYMHMSRYIVTSGQFVMAGQIIGYCGATGTATGSHLHFGIYLDGEAVNPADYMEIR